LIIVERQEPRRPENFEIKPGEEEAPLFDEISVVRVLTNAHGGVQKI